MLAPLPYRPNRTLDLRTGWLTIPGMDSPLNPYTGQVSVLGIMDMIQAGQTTFPHNMGATPPQPMTRADWLHLRSAAYEQGNIEAFNEANAALGL